MGRWEIKEGGWQGRKGDSVMGRNSKDAEEEVRKGKGEERRGGKTMGKGEDDGKGGKARKGNGREGWETP